MDPNKDRRKRVKRYGRRYYIRREVERRGGKELSMGVRRGVGPRMKRNKPHQVVVQKSMLCHSGAHMRIGL